MAKKRRHRRKDRQPHSEISGLIIIAAAILAGASLLFTENTGYIGGLLNRLQQTIAGEYALFVPFILILWGLRVMFFPNSSLFARRSVGVILIVLCVLTAVHILAAPEGDYSPQTLWAMTRHENVRGGGVLGALGAMGLYQAFGLVGGVVVLSSLTFIGLFLLMNISLRQFLHWCVRSAKAGSAAIVRTLAKINAGIARLVRRPKPAAEPQIPVVIHDYQAPAAAEEKEDGALLIQPEGEQQAVFPRETQPAPAPAPELFIEDEEAQELAEYQLPPLHLLQKTVRLKDPQGRRELVSQADILEETLASFGIEAKVINVHRGPTITRFEIQPAAGVKVSRIVNLADDLALSLAATGVRIEAPIPGKSAIGLEIANKAKSTVYLREVLESEAFVHNDSKLAIALGKDIAGEPVVADLMEIPHLLIAGATGSGKSVCLNSIIISLLYKAKPNELKFLLIDPKVVEFNVYNGLPHLLCPVVTDPRMAAQGLKNIVREMEHRYQLFAAKSARDIIRYNELAVQNGEKPLPYIIVVIDELADLMMTAAAEVEDTICRIAQKSRAAGIHLIVATQRPSVDVITGVIKANITSRIAFAVSSQADSRTILDMAGAEKLLGRGDMLYYPVGAAKPRRVQSAYISEDEVEKVVAYILGQALPLHGSDFLDASALEDEGQLSDVDELLPEAARLLVESGQASISMLQRRLRIGYTRAARLIDDMEQLGIVGGYEGSKARKILVNMAQLEEILSGLEK
ncbi:MAG: DNA translocase FtsK [Firmicutes bacterium]|nr:DNA translocase FtsK [Bacillota bacterium]HQE01032.1 DNA translocase FtsK 4TM domain-containing protein [Bacillota bacterium]